MRYNHQFLKHFLFWVLIDFRRNWRLQPFEITQSIKERRSASTRISAVLLCLVITGRKRKKKGRVIKWEIICVRKSWLRPALWTNHGIYFHSRCRHRLHCCLWISTTATNVPIHRRPGKMLDLPSRCAMCTVPSNKSQQSVGWYSTRRS